MNEINEDGETLVTAMTRPAMLGGLSLTSIGISCFFPMLLALITRSVYPFGLMLVTLTISYLVCLKDVYLFEIALSAVRIVQPKKGSRVKHIGSRTKHIWGCKRYAPR